MFATSMLEFYFMFTAVIISEIVTDFFSNVSIKHIRNLPVVKKCHLSLRRFFENLVG